MKDTERIERIRRALQRESVDVVLCALPLNVLLLSGYWPVVGTSLVIASADGEISLLVPEDEEDLAKRGWADEVITFHPGSLEKITTAADAIRDPLQDLRTQLGRELGRIGYEADESSEGASYAALHLYGGTIRRLLSDVFASATLAPADELLRRLRSVKTPDETNRLRTACRFAEGAFRKGSSQLRVGLTEVEAAALFREPLSAALPDFPKVERADGFVYCMSGANSALASGAYARSRGKRIETGDLVLVHCNSYADGYWTDITRTYCIGPLQERKSAMYGAVFAAREAALGALASGVKAVDVDKAARDVLKARGFGPQFKHSTGHGVGFSAIDANAQPRLHPQSEDTIEAGSVFNVEPAIYFDGYGGIRHCDMMAITENGAELLTPFQCSVDELLLGNP